MDDIRLFEQRRKDRLVKRMRSTFNTDERARLACIIYKTCYRTDGGPKSGNHGHAGVPGQRGGSAPSGAASSAASVEKLSKFKETFNNCGMKQKYEYLNKAGALSRNLVDAMEFGHEEYHDLQNLLESGDKDAIEKFESEINKTADKYFEQAEKAREPKSLDVPKRDELMELDDDKKADWAYESQDRELTEDEKKWANDSSDFQKVAIDLGMNGTPQVVSEEDFNKYVEENDAPVIYRGVRAAGEYGLSVQNIQYETLYEEDKPFIGNGVDCDGLYFSDNIETAHEYGYGAKSSPLKCALRPDAKIVNESDKKLDEAYYDYGRDEATAAAMLGYDAIQIDAHHGETYYVVLNKSALIACDPMDGEMDKLMNS